MVYKIAYQPDIQGIYLLEFIDIFLFLNPTCISYESQQNEKCHTGHII